MSVTTKERPILFSGEMVRAILDGRKTQTRRVVKPQPPAYATEVFAWHPPDDLHPDMPVAGSGMYVRTPSGLQNPVPCPYGVPGDHLWVRESLRGVNDTTFDDSETMPIAAYAADGAHIWKAKGSREPWVWKRPTLPSIHMPRRLCRIVLEITEVRVQRLQEIAPHPHVATEQEIADVKAEGIASGRWDEFASLWDRINSKRGFDWNSNPWVWCISFRTLERTQP